MENQAVHQQLWVSPKLTAFGGVDTLTQFNKTFGGTDLYVTMSSPLTHVIS
jgi:hypothetical protein